MIDESKNLKKLLERSNIFDEIKHNVTQIKDTTYSEENTSDLTAYDKLVEEVLGTD